MKSPHHNWKHHSGDGRNVPSDIVERRAYCGALKKMKEVVTSRIGLTTASFTQRDVPIYSTNEAATWSWLKPACTGKPVAAKAGAK